MNTKKLICIIASATFLLSCVGWATSPTPRPSPTPRTSPTPRPRPGGKRTEVVGTVTGLTPTQITVTTSTGAIVVISRSDSCYKLVSGVVAVGNTVDIIYCVPASSCPGCPLS